MIPPWLQTVITALLSVFASSGFWLYLQRKAEKKDAKTELLLGLAHERIVSLGLDYIHRGWISTDELENLECLYVPYANAGGNGTAKKVFDDVKKLPYDPPGGDEA